MHVVGTSLLGFSINSRPIGKLLKVPYTNNTALHEAVSAEKSIVPPQRHISVAGELNFYESKASLLTVLLSQRQIVPRLPIRTLFIPAMIFTMPFCRSVPVPHLAVFAPDNPMDRVLDDFDAGKVGESRLMQAKSRGTCTGYDLPLAGVICCRAAPDAEE